VIRQPSGEFPIQKEGDPELSRAEPTKIEVLLNQVAKGFLLTERLQAIIDTPFYPDFSVSPSNKEKHKAFCGVIQNRIDQLTAMRENVLSIIRQIPDCEQQTVIKMRYGFIGSKTDWNTVAEQLGFWTLEPVMSRHRKALKTMEDILERTVNTDASA
jgi:hypothetical protein